MTLIKKPSVSFLKHIDPILLFLNIPLSNKSSQNWKKLK